MKNLALTVKVYVKFRNLDSSRASRLLIQGYLRAPRVDTMLYTRIVRFGKMLFARFVRFIFYTNKGLVLELFGLKISEPGSLHF